jgi:sugar lactone lactonase YvrE
MGAAVVLSAAVTVAAVSAPAAFAAANTLSRLAGTGSYARATAPGPATSSSFLDAEGVAVDHSGDVYFASSDDREVFKVTPGGYLTVVAGTGTLGSATPGVATSSDLSFPNGVALDSSGNLYIADSGNSQVYKVTPSGTLSIVAGTGATGAPTPGPAVSSALNGPADVKVDSAGDLYIADFNGNYVEKVNASGTLSVVAGTGTAAMETPGPATSSALSGPDAVAVDPAGNLYIGDSGNNVVEKVTPAGTLSVVAGDGTGGLSTAGPATSRHLDYPAGVAVDAAGDLYITNNGGAQVVEVAAGQLSVIAGNGVNGPSSYGGPATSSDLGYPFGIAVTPAGGLVMGDDGNNTVDLIGALITAPAPVTAPAITGTAAVGQTLSADPGPWLDYPTSYSYQWQRCDASGANCANIAGATTSSYTVLSGDDGGTIRVVVTATNGVGSTPASSAVTTSVPGTPPTTPTPTPTPVVAPVYMTLGAVPSAGLPVSNSGKVSLTLICPVSPTGCDASGVLVIHLSKVLLGSAAHLHAARIATPQNTVLASFSGQQIASGHSALIAVSVNPGLLRRLQSLRIRRVKVTLTISNHLTGGSATVTTDDVYLRIPQLGARECPVATGQLASSTLGPFTLGITRGQARQLLRDYKVRNYRSDNFCLFRANGIRVGYGSRKLLGTASGTADGKLILALSANHYYTIDGIRPGDTLSAAARKAHLSPVVHAGLNDWYIIPGATTNGVLKVRHGLVKGVGIVTKSLTSTHAQQLHLLRNF